MFEVASHPRASGDLETPPPLQDPGSGADAQQARIKKSSPLGCFKFGFRNYLNPGASAQADETFKR